MKELSKKQKIVVLIFLVIIATTIIYYVYGKDTGKYDEEFGSRIIVLHGDITKPGFGLNEEVLNKISNDISSVINSAALVKHYGDYNKFNLINVVGTKNVVDFCKKYHKKLYHISTTSVSGMGLPENNQKKSKKVLYFSEKDLYKGQNLNNTYIKTS